MEEGLAVNRVGVKKLPISINLKAQFNRKGGAERAQENPMRQCVGCREMKPKKELIRVVRSPEGQVSWILGASCPAGGPICALPRPVWPGPERAGPWSGPFPPLPDEVWAGPGGADEGGAPEMPNDPILPLLGLARKAGRLEIGEEPVGAACRARQARLVLLAATPPPTPAAGPPTSARRATCCGWRSLHQGGAGLCPGPGLLRHAGPDGRGLCRPPGAEAGRPGPGAYGPAAQQLKEKADRVLQRQRESGQHEKNLREGGKSPWARPPQEREEPAPAGPPRRAKQPPRKGPAAAPPPSLRPRPDRQALRPAPAVPQGRPRRPQAVRQVPA